MAEGLENGFEHLASACVVCMEALVKVAVNGTADQFPENSTIRDILASKTLQEEIVIVFLNGEMTKSESWAETRLRPGDKIEIIRVVGGG
jgi:sulfur carrier protein